MNLDLVRHFEVNGSLVEETDEALREAGDEGYERFVLWSGVVLDDVALVRSIHVPEQRSFKTDDGLLVRVDGDALHKLNAWLYENKESLLVQVHAHPTDAYHSETDDAYPIVTAIGSLSVVASDFGRHGSLGRGAAVYRLTSSGWNRIPLRKLRKLVKVS